MSEEEKEAQEFPPFPGEGFMKEEKEEEIQQEDAPPAEQKPEPIPDVKPFNTDKVMIVAGVLVLLIFLAVIFLPKYLKGPSLTLDELHERNLQGKLKPDQGYVYNGHSFVFYDSLLYTSVVNPGRTKQITLPFHFGPRDTEAIAPLGEYNASLFDSSRDIFMTFDPKDEGLPFIGVATGETDQVLINAFGKGVIAACTRNESFPCSARPKVDCDTAAPVIYFATENQTNVLFLDNCIIVSGREKELWKAADRMLFHFLGIQ